MNASEHIQFGAHSLASEQQLTVKQCLEIIDALLDPYSEHGSRQVNIHNDNRPMREPKHFTAVNNDIIHKWLARRHRRRVRAMNPQERAEHDAELRDYRNETRRRRHA